MIWRLKERAFSSFDARWKIAYTMQRALSRNEEGVLTTPSGYVVQPEIQIPEGVTSINISAAGNVSVTIGANNAAEEIGQLT